MNRKLIKRELDSIKIRIKNKIDKKDYNSALYLSTVCSKILYDSNYSFYDDQLESYICEISNNMFNDYSFEYKTNKDTVLFYDSFGLDRRGLAQIYLSALCSLYKVVYVTFDDRKNSIPEISKIISNNKGSMKFITRSSSYVQQIHELNKIVNDFYPRDFIFYSRPFDVIAPTIMHLYKGKMNRYLINLTDHAFWLGVKCIDKCIEFRDYGASVSRDYRGIDESKIVKIPFYPLINYNQKFEGFPFEKKDSQQVLFSGGNIYKTISKDNEYYNMIRHILDSYPNIIFWYAGSGYSKDMDKLAADYKNRVYITDERNDLFQVLCNCDFYISTYPICGGLMFQYAASAGLVPLTLKDSQISDDFLIRQNGLNIEFDQKNELYREMERLVIDENYRNERSKEMKRSVITPIAFKEKIYKLLENQNIEEVSYYYVDNKRMIDRYVDSFSNRRMCINYVELSHIGISLKNNLFRTIAGLSYGFVSFLKMRIIRNGGNK